MARTPGRPPAGTTPDSRSALLDAAARVLAARGYAAASVDRIAAQAGFSKGTFYWHFPSKEDLFLALIEERVDAPARELMAITRTAPADAVTAPTVSAGLAALFDTQREMFVLLHEYWSAATRDGRVRRRWKRRRRGLVGTLAEALRARHEETGVPLTIDAERLALAFLALAQGLALEAAVDENAVDGALYGEILALVYDGLAARAARAGG